MYKWLETETGAIETKKFHVIEGNQAGGISPLSEELASSLPPSYLAFWGGPVYPDNIVSKLRE